MAPLVSWPPLVEFTNRRLISSKSDRTYGFSKGANWKDEEDFKCFSHGWVHLIRHMTTPAKVESAGGSVWVPLRCKEWWLCQYCSEYRQFASRRRIREYLRKYSAKHYYFITRSIKNRFGLEQAYEELMECLRINHNKLRKSNPDPWKVVKAWASVIEIKLSEETGWNVHQHVVVASDEPQLDLAKLASVWNRSAGYNAHYNLKRVNDLNHAVNYITKYMTKVSVREWNEDLFESEKEFLNSVRLFQRKGGTSYAKSGKKYVACCLYPEKHGCYRESEEPRIHLLNETGDPLVVEEYSVGKTDWGKKWWVGV